VVLGAVVASLFVQMPYYTLSPGKVWPTEELISVEGAETFDQTDGEVSFTTVSLKHASALEALVGWADPSVEVVDEDLILGGQSEDENREVNQQMMMSSQQVASAVALEELGYDVVTGTGATIDEVSEGLPADGLVEEGETIVAIDGQDVQLWEDVVRLVSVHAPGESVALTVEGADGGTREVTAPLVSRCEALQRDIERAQEEKKEPPESQECTDELAASPVFGVIGTTRGLDLAFPIDVTIDAGDVGGPSAGLAFTLGVLDVLTPGELTGGSKVATTGTMALDGTVGPVGGVRQKTAAARGAGVELFLVPTAEYEEAAAHAGDMKVVAVDTLDEALAELDELGGNALALGRPGEAQPPS
jgi:PDZ domain-containing protein